MIRTAQQSDRQTDGSPKLQCTCHWFSKALNSVSSDAIKRTFNTLRPATDNKQFLLVIVAHSHSCSVHYIC